MVIYEGIGCRLKGKWGAKAQQTAWIKNTADCIPVEIDPAALLLSSSFSLSLSNTHMHTLTLLRPRPHFHGPKIEASTWLTEKQKEASESRFSPKTNCLPLWRRKKKEARHHKEEVSPAILTLLPPLSSSNATESEGVSETKFEWSTQTSSHSWQSLFRKMFFLYWSSSKAAKIKSF